MIFEKLASDVNNAARIKMAGGFEWDELEEAPSGNGVDLIGGAGRAVGTGVRAVGNAADYVGDNVIAPAVDAGRRGVEFIKEAPGAAYDAAGRAYDAASDFTDQTARRIENAKNILVNRAKAMPGEAAEFAGRGVRALRRANDAAVDAAASGMQDMSDRWSAGLAGEVPLSQMEAFMQRQIAAKRNRQRMMSETLRGGIADVPDYINSTVGRGQRTVSGIGDVLEKRLPGLSEKTLMRLKDELAGGYAGTANSAMDAAGAAANFPLALGKIFGDANDVRSSRMLNDIIAGPLKDSPQLLNLLNAGIDIGPSGALAGAEDFANESLGNAENLIGEAGGNQIAELAKMISGTGTKAMQQVANNDKRRDIKQRISEGELAQANAAADMENLPSATLDNIISQISGGVSGTRDAIANGVGRIRDSITNGASQAGDAISSGVSDIKDRLSSGASDLSEKYMQADPDGTKTLAGAGGLAGVVMLAKLLARLKGKNAGPAPI